MISEPDRFLAAVSEFDGEWTSLDVRAMAIRGDDNAWHLRALRVVLLPAKKTRRMQGPRTTDLWTAHEVLPVKHLERLVRSIGEGTVQIAGRNLILKQEQNNRVGLSFQTAIQDSRYAVHKELPSSCFVLGTKSSHQFGADYWRLERLEADLAALETPWEGYDDVLRNFLGEHQFDARPYDVAIHFIAPIGVSFTSVAYVGHELRASIRGTRKTDSSRTRLALLEHGPSGTVHRRQVKPIQKGRSGWQIRCNLRDDTVRVVAILGYRGVRAGYWTRLLPKASATAWVRAVDHFLPGKDILGDGLLNPEIRGKNLEPWAALLFARLGFQTIMLGKFPGDLPDLLAEGSENELLLIECTEDSPDPNDKLGKLSQRARRLEVALGVDVHPVLLTRAPMETIPETHRTKAREEGIALVAREQLLELGERMLQAPDIQKTTAFLISCIPADNRQVPGRWGISSLL